MNQIIIKEKEHKAFMKGEVTVQTFKTGMVAALEPYIKMYKEAWQRQDRDIAKAIYEDAQRMMKTFLIDTPVVQENMVMQDGGYGLDLIIQRLVSINTYSLNIQYGEIGTGSTPVTLLDHALTTPTARAVQTFQQDFGAQQAILQFFFPDGTLTNQTYNEFGTFVDGNTTIGTGQLFNHALFSSPYVKVAGQDTTVQVVFTLSQ